MATPSDKTMFEIYREADYGRQYRVVYFTELDEHNKEAEINRALSGEHFFDGFLTDLKKDEGKQRIAEIIRRLNAGETIDSAEVEKTLSGMMA
ncbi:MAG: hypothetical protein HS101_10195 [Planctomycetia bacterium]|jgi:hypothetical protein|nr:hypothetical protein [Planctomycetia bacterium]OQZ01914.1 MAG: hypothetical protein B6D36_13600 [Planctomycetes bacterium UTPLA1]